MPVKQSLFALANYLLLAFIFFLGISLLRFVIEVVPSNESLLPLLPSISSFIIMIINCLFNLIIFHRKLPDRSISKQTIHLYFISWICFIISLIIISFILFSSYNDELKETPDGNFAYVILFLSFLFLITGLIIAINQFNIIKYLKLNQKKNTEE